MVELGVQTNATAQREWFRVAVEYGLKTNIPSLLPVETTKRSSLELLMSIMAAISKPTSLGGVEVKAWDISLRNKEVCLNDNKNKNTIRSLYDVPCLQMEILE